MEEKAAKTLIQETFGQPYDRDRFKTFARNLVSGYEERHKAGQIPDSFKDHIQSYCRIGKIIDADTNEIDIVEVKLKKTGSVHRARTMQRNFAARYLKRRDKDAALVAFVSEDETSWRFSLVTQEHQLYEDLKGRIKTSAILTPAKRLSFRVGAGEKTHTAMRQMVPILVNDAPPTLAILRQAFSVETVSKEFFNKYRELFYRSVEAIDKFLESDEEITKHFADRGIETADFAKRLLGQIVFLYFLQKKGWLGVPADGKWGEGDRGFLRTLYEQARERRENFFDQYLEPLFYDALAIDNGPEDNFHDRFGCRIPFLNGGLFEPYNDYQWQRTTILIDDALFSNSFTTSEGDVGDGILDIFDRYNFTVAEDEPLEKEVAVDPEMLGKVFENLLEVKDRKQSGTYYTPREIVHYMCQESLIAYLARRVPTVPKDDLETFIRYGELFLETDAEVQDRKAGKKGDKGADSKIYGDYVLPDTVREEAAELNEALATVRVCDPAIGSGAFPVGMMTEIVRARAALGQYMDREIPQYNLKYQTIHDSLFGVDIDPGAIEIAKLRLWLSLVVDEEAYEDVQPLPNLDYRIMQGNSLLETYEGIKLFDDSILKSDLDTRDKETVKTRLKVRQNELAEESKALAQQPLNGRHKSRRKEIDAEARKTQKALKTFEAASEDGLPDMPLLTPLSEVARKELWLRDLHDKYFFEAVRSRKIDLRKEIEDVEWELIEASLKENGRADRLEDLERYRQTKTRPFFLWHLHFSEVFHPELDVNDEKPHPGGFDIVIGNPPYIRHEAIRDQKLALEEEYGWFYRGTADLYTYFYKRGLELVKTDGVLAFITPNKFMSTSYGDKTRKLLSEDAHPLVLIDFGELPVFTAATDPCIGIYRKAKGFTGKFRAGIFKTPDQIMNLVTTLERDGLNMSVEDLRSTGWKIEHPEILSLLNKIKGSGVPLGEYVQGQIFYGIKTGYNRAFIIDEETKSKLIEEDRNSAQVIKPWLRGGGIKKWFANESAEYLLNIPWHFPLHMDTSITGASKEAEQAFKNQFPAVYNHLLQFKDNLELRNQAETGIRYEWYALQRWGASYYEKIEKPKIVYNETSKELHAFIDKENLFLNKTCFMILSDSKEFLIGILLSKVFDYYYRLEFPSWGDPWSGGRVQFRRDRMEAVPISNASPDQKAKIANIAEQILDLKAGTPDADVSGLEAKIDQLVYQLYDLTDDEIALIETSLAGGET